MARLAWLGWVALVVAPAAAGWMGCGGDDSTDKAASGAAGTGDPPCTSPADCGADSFCAKRTCVAGVCGIDPTPEGTPLMTDSVGDCARRVCDGQGGERMEEDPTDTKSDGKECTIDACENGVPVNTPVAPGTMCSQNEGRYCHSDAECRFCPEVSAACEDTQNGEPNDDQAVAVDLGSVGAASAGKASACGVLKGATDVDWYVYEGQDDGRTAVNPAHDFHGADVTVCVYAACVTGATDVACGGGSTAATAPNGQPGCCGKGAFSLLPSSNDLCPGADADVATIWIEVKAGSNAACTPYQLDVIY